MHFSYIDPKEYIGLPEPMINWGIYSKNIPYKKTKWSNDYATEPIKPDASEYAKHYFELARYQINSATRPGNNSILNNPYNFISNKYNFMCYNTDKL